MFYKVFQNAFQRKNLRLDAFNQSQHVQMKRLLQVGQLVKRIEDFLRGGVAFEFNHDSHSFPVRFVAEIFDSFNSFVFHQIGDMFDQGRFVDQKRNFGNDDLELLARFFLQDFNRAARGNWSPAG
ncbi:MAG: gyrase subunit A protein [Candidatus Azambacteria bacterium GW2011_GWA2_45_90]|uniref:Gyrase subunit A protein n=1 Tax=Candidatus Azambacteria bacterium GW2011_GWA2_45_90 TaxID=1618614 RepID=A0A0G1NA70_9BACT|nr:MAG: gyrase subunit A protein [Candidatus Azambacteria bacterium GW2011_GWA2_45_90]